MDEAVVLQSLPHPVLALDSADRVTYANPAAVALLGDGLVGRDAVELVAPADRPRARQQLLAAQVRVDGPGPAAGLRLAGEPERWVAVRAAPAGAGRTVLSLAAVTDQTLSRRRLRRSERRFRAAFEAGEHGAALLDHAGHVVAVNGALVALLGREREELVGTHVSQLFGPDAPAGGWPGHGTSSRRLQQPGGRLVHVQVTVTNVPVDAGERLSLLQVQDVTERRRSEQRLRHLALHDPLTDLPARHLLIERLRSALEQRAAPTPYVAALFVDLDEFKLVNDGLGHAVGDLVLRETAARLRLGTRPQDTVARLSGDEFVVVCPALATREEAVAIADRLSVALRAPVRAASDEVLVSASIGVAFAGLGHTTAEQLLLEADQAMYRAKQRGRRRFEVFDQALRERAGERDRLRNLLAREPQDRAVVHYRPVVELAGRRVVGLTARLRLRSDDGTLIADDAWLDVGAEAGRLSALHDLLLRSAVAQVALVSERYGRPLGLAVELGPAPVDEELSGRVLAVLGGSGLAPARLVLGVHAPALRPLAPGLTRLRDAGVGLALVGAAGSGPPALLRQPPLQALALDHGAVAGLPGDADGRVRAVLRQAAQLGLPTAAAGVTTEEQHEALLALGVEYGSGDLYAPALTAAELPGALDRLGVHEDGGWPRAERDPDDKAG